MPKQHRGFEDFELGEVFTIPSKTLTDAHFLFYSGLSGDNHPIHYDVEYCKQTPFGRPLAHGLLVVGLTALGASDLDRTIGMVFLEQSSRFLKPLFVGDTVYPTHEVVELIPKPGRGGIVKLRTQIRNQHGEVVMEGMHVYLCPSVDRSHQ